MKKTRKCSACNIKIDKTITRKIGLLVGTVTIKRKRTIIITT